MCTHAYNIPLESAVSASGHSTKLHKYRTDKPKTGQSLMKAELSFNCLPEPSAVFTTGALSSELLFPTGQGTTDRST